ncbi:MAG: polysaccharide biosynthesis tyrosine autokinase [Acidobacteria bacterium]|nr:polysaccharide biosynthesis tyrosine autokinase [Acidobacteriota bacterium]
MDKDERLIPVPTAKEVQLSTHEYPAAYSPIYEEDGFSEQRSLREYFNVVYKRLPLILALSIVVTSIVAFYMYRQPSQYESSTTLLIEPPRPKVTSKDSININFGGDANYTNTQLKLLQNPDLMRDVVIRLGLHRDPNLFANQNKGILATLRALFSGDKAKTEKESSLPLLTENNDSSDSKNEVQLTTEERERAENYAAILLGGLRIEPVEKTNLVNLSIQSTNADLCPKVADMTADLFIEKNADREMSGGRANLEKLTNSIDELRNTITNQESELINLLRGSDLPLQEKGGDFRNSALQTLYTQYQDAKNERLKIEARYNTALQANNRGEGTNIPDLTDSKIYQETVRLNTERKAKLQDEIRNVDKQIQDEETSLAALRTKYTDDYPKVRETIAKIQNLKDYKVKREQEVTETIARDQKKMEKDAVGGALVALKSQLDAAQKREAQLYAGYQNEEQKANFEGQQETKLITLKREIETNRGLLDTYTQRQKEQELAISSGKPENLKVTTNAIKPGGPIGPQRTRNIIVAFLVSLAAGIGLAFLLDYLDDSIRTSDDVGRHLGLPTLALIPHQTSNEKRKLALATKNGGNTSMALVALEDTRSAMAEAYRHLRTSLLFSSAGKPPQTILVTSSQPSEGKTTTAINTAITLAQSGADVVIIDCDLRRPRLHSHFNLENSVGLTNYLSGEKNTELMMKPYPGLPKMKIITSGPIPPNPAELLSSHEMKNLLQFLRGNFKHVIIDSPPAISFTDAAILSTLVDGVVLVAMAGKSSIHLMRRFKQRLSNIGARIYGVVLNGIKSDSVEYGYYGYGYTYNYYATPEDDSTPLMENVEKAASIHDTKS